jgi:hypothetical protein
VLAAAVATSVAAGCAAPHPHRATVARADALMQGAPGRTGDLTLQCDPPDAVVEVDGIPQGACGDFDGRQRRLSLGHGMRRVDVKKEGYWPYQTYYQAGGARAALVISLRPRTQSEGVMP